MKKILYPILAAAVVASACNKQEPLPGNGSDNGGVETSGPGAEMTISLKVASDGPSTKATDAGTEQERKLTSASAYVFNEVGTLEAVAEFENAAVTPSTKVKVSLGKKTVYVLANLLDTPQGAIPGYPEPNMQKEVMTISAINDIIGEDNNPSFAMSGYSTTEVQSSTGGVNNNQCSVTLTRLSAKVSVTNNAIDASAEKAAGTLDNVKVKPRNIAAKEYYFPYPSTEWSTPNYEASAVDAANYLNPDTGTAGTFSPISNPVYVSENKVSTPKNGNTTYLILQATFTPKEVYKADGSGIDANWSAGTFFRYQNADGTFAPKYYSASPTDQSLSGGNPVEYTDGTSYYRVLVSGDQANTDLSKRYSVQRNTLINLSITHATGAGSNTEDGVVPKDPETPIDETSDLTVTVTVADWTSVDQSTGVGDM